MIRTSEFLRAFRQLDEPLHLRAFKPKNTPDTPENRPLLWDTSLAELASSRALQTALRTANAHRGVYFSVNVGGATDDSITRYKAFFAESDNRSIAEQHAAFDSAPLLPSIRNETRNSVHGFWLINGQCEKVEWLDVQSRLIGFFNSDPKIKNPSRVMRLPRFDHIHLNGNGAVRKKVITTHFEPGRRYTVEQMRDAFPAPESKDVSQQQQQPANGTIDYHEDRHAELCQRIMSRGNRNSKGNWDTKCLAHNGAGNKGLVYFPATGAIKCNAEPACDYFQILRAEGLPDGHLPSRESAKSEEPKAELKKVREKKPRSALFVDPEPHNDSVGGADLLNKIEAFICRFVDADESQVRAATLWAAFTHCYESFYVCPLLCATSPVKRSGKTTLLTVLGPIVARPLITSSISSAALFRAIEEFKPTLLIDEADTFLNDNEDLRGVINSGHTRATATVVRCNEKLEVQTYSTFAPKVIAMIGSPKDTIVDRSIVLRMKRAPGATREMIRADRLVEEAGILRSMAAKFALDNAQLLGNADPSVPEQITSARARDNWRPLLAIADQSGGDWPQLARKAAIELSGFEELDNESLGEMLLADIQKIFNDEGVERMFSKTLCERLAQMEDRPWPEINHGKPLTPAGLSRRLKPFGILPNTLRIDGVLAKGYEMNRFQEVFQRYLGGTPQMKRNNVAEPIKKDESAKSKRNTEDFVTDDVTDRNGTSALKNGPCNVVTDEKRDGARFEPYREPTKEEWAAAAKDPEMWEQLVITAEREAIECEGSQVSMICGS